MSEITVYHHPLSVCSMKVRLALEEKGLAWTSREVDIVHAQQQLDPEYIQLNPKGVVPTLVHSNDVDEVVTNSAKIICYIASLEEGNVLIPSDQKDVEIMDELINVADSIDLQILSYAQHPSMEKSEKILDARIEKSLGMAKKHPELEEAYKVCAERSMNNKNFRVDPEHISQIEQGAHDAVKRIENQLANNSFLMGKNYTVADVIWTVVLSRLELLGYDDWISKNKFPNVADYYSKMKQRKSYQSANVQNQWWQK